MGSVVCPTQIAKLGSSGLTEEKLSTGFPPSQQPRYEAKVCQVAIVVYHLALSINNNGLCLGARPQEKSGHAHTYIQHVP